MSTVPTVPLSPVAEWRLLRWLTAIGSAASALYGMCCLAVLLAFFAPIPIANCLALGYVLAVEGRVARTGQLRSALSILPVASRAGSLALGAWVGYLLVRLVGDSARDAATIAPNSLRSLGWQIAWLLTVILVAFHLVLAVLRGSYPLFFLSPLRNLSWLRQQIRRGKFLGEAWMAFGEFAEALQIVHHFWLGVRCLLGTAVWIVFPTILFAAFQLTVTSPFVYRRATSIAIDFQKQWVQELAHPSQPIPMTLTLLGWSALTAILIWLPFLQAEFAATSRFKSLFDVRSIVEDFRRAPWRHSLAVGVTYMFTAPYFFLQFSQVFVPIGLVDPPLYALDLQSYVLTVSLDRLFSLFSEIAPAQFAVQYASLAWVATTIPARLVVAWAYARGNRTPQRGSRIVCGVCSVLLVLAVGRYLYQRFMAPVVASAGWLVLFEQPGLWPPLMF